MSGALESALPPETLEGWYALHQIFRVDRAALRALPGLEFKAMAEKFTVAIAQLGHAADARGWSAVVPLIGSHADVMFVHFRASLDDLGMAQRTLAATPLMDFMDGQYTFLSVTEAGLYHLTAQLAKDAIARGGTAGDEQYISELKSRVDAERSTEHVKKRLYPPYPGAEMPYVCFYPMDKRRDAAQNWYTLSLEQRSELMRTHGTTGRRYAGRVQQIITGAIGFDAWEWGVTLFAKDPLDFKKLVTDMRFDEVSAKYAEFGEFYVGKVSPPGPWVASLRP